MADLPLIPTLGVGSHATPGWLFLFRERMRDGRLGPDDVDEAFEDATRAAIADQLEAGIDIISDGELRRMRFVYEMYDRIDGLDRRPPTRRLGLAGYDRAPKFFAVEKLTAPGGLGLVEEYALLARLCPDHPLKIAFPGPLTFARNIDPLPAYGEGEAGLHGLMDDLVAIARAEMAALAAAGAEFIQLDEPGFANPPEGLSVAEGAGIVNRVLDGFEDRAAVHVCFGNNASRPYVRRDFARLFPGLDLLGSRTLLLEFANREMADLDRLADLPDGCRIAAGVIDVKSFHQETAEEVADRLRRVLEHVPPERLMATTDCGFSALPRWLAKVKLQALGAGARLVRAELGG